MLSSLSGKQSVVLYPLLALICSVGLHLIFVASLIWVPFRSAPFQFTGAALRYCSVPIRSSKQVKKSHHKVLDNRIPPELLHVLKQEVILKIIKVQEVKPPVSKKVLPPPVKKLQAKELALPKKIEKPAAPKTKQEKTSNISQEKPTPEKTESNRDKAAVKSSVLPKPVVIKTLPEATTQKNTLSSKEVTIEKPMTQAKVSSPIQERVREMLEHEHFSIEVQTDGDNVDTNNRESDTQALLFAQEVNHLISQKWEPMAGWEDAGPVVIRVSLQKALDIYREPEMVLKSKSIVKNQHALNIVRTLIQSGAMNGCVFNLTFK